jgi:hypothetical protein
MKKGGILIYILFLILLGAGSAGSYYYFNKTGKMPWEVNKIQVTPTAPPAEILPTATPTATLEEDIQSLDSVASESADFNEVNQDVEKL